METSSTSSSSQKKPSAIATFLPQWTGEENEDEKEAEEMSSGDDNTGSTCTSDIALRIKPPIGSISLKAWMNNDVNILPGDRSKYLLMLKSTINPEFSINDPPFV
jgi:hypothetical protein